ncbi:MAG TPA: succinylglutamate desuccinylase/aspartoacylase family protein, partial [Labilithrix sp.]|nr:succinylglutamate desuccinylase/aspartoacylase family protein [Labilithrix sp.]
MPEGREIGRIRGDAPGPTLVVVAGIHGNERAGVVAARRTLTTLTRRRGTVRGELLALSGNLGAMRLGVRYRERDLNRVWTAERIADLEARHRAGAPLDAEDQEQLELLGAIRSAALRARGPVYLIDLHTTSAHGFPFVLFGDTLKQRKFGSAFPLAVLLGLEEQIDGVLSSYWTTQGCITCGVEGGQHDDPGSIDNLEAVLLLGAEAAGLFGSARLTETAAAHALLDRRRGDLPRVMEVVSRHAITAADDFVMEPGFANLARARVGQLLARSRRGEIRAPKDGMVILPLYQGQGADGFFWGREMSASRMRLSEALR